jgi:hypothetical protein
MSPGQDILAIEHTIYDLFTKVTFLFTIQIPQTEKYQGRFAESILIEYEKSYLCADLAAGSGKRTSICQSRKQK